MRLLKRRAPSQEPADSLSPDLPLTSKLLPREMKSLMDKGLEGSFQSSPREGGIYAEQHVTRQKERARAMHGDGRQSWLKCSGRSEPSSMNGAQSTCTGEMSEEGEGDDNDNYHHYILEGTRSAATGPVLSLQHLQRPGEKEHRLHWSSSSSEPSVTCSRSHS